jgi:predicted NUDIX family NTP pyrophosphohydrolase
MCAEWPRGSGRWLSRWVTFPEVDRCEWFDAERRAREKINPAQVGLSDRLQGALSATRRASLIRAPLRIHLPPDLG